MAQAVPIPPCLLDLLETERKLHREYHLNNYALEQAKAQEVPDIVQIGKLRNSLDYYGQQLNAVRTFMAEYLFDIDENF